MIDDARGVPVVKPTLFNRLWRGAVELTLLELRLLHQFVEEMPPDFRQALESQIRFSNVIQRDPEWIELRFYTFVGTKVDRSGLPMLPVRAGEIKLLSISFDADDGEPRYANFWAVDQRFVMVNFDRSIRNVRLVQNIDVLRIRRSWRSNIE